MRDRIEIEKVDNGYQVTVWKSSEEKKDDYGYVEPKKLIAKDSDEVKGLVDEHLK